MCHLGCILKNKVFKQRGRCIGLRTLHILSEQELATKCREACGWAATKNFNPLSAVNSITEWRF